MANSTGVSISVKRQGFIVKGNQILCVNCNKLFSKVLKKIYPDQLIYPHVEQLMEPPYIALK